MLGITEDEVSEDNMKYDKPVLTRSFRDPYRSPHIGWMDKISFGGLTPWSSLLQEKEKCVIWQALKTAPSEDDPGFPLCYSKNPMIMTCLMNSMEPDIR